MKWISVKDRLPDSDYEVLAYNGSKCIYVGQYYRHDNTWEDDSATGMVLESVTHWMPLPEPPEDT